MTMVYIWLAIFIVSIVVELIVPALVSIWFAAGSLVSLILSLFLQEHLIWLQIVVFVVISAAFILAIRPLIKKNQKGELKSNVDSIVGKIGFVEDDILQFQTGTVKINGLVWAASLVSDNLSPIVSGEKVVVEEVNGNKLKVKKYTEDK